jgi:hypothetical protein
MRYGNIDLIPIDVPIVGIVQRIGSAVDSNYFLVTIYLFDIEEVKKLNRYNDKEYAADEEVFYTHTVQLLILKTDIKLFKIKIGHIIEVQKQKSNIFVKVNKVIFNG